MATLKFSTRSSVKGDKLVPIYLRLKEGKSVDVRYKTGLQVKPEHFDNKQGVIRHKADFSNKDEIAKKLRDLKNHILDELALFTSPPNKHWLEKTIQDFHTGGNGKKGKETLYEFIERFIKNSDARINPRTGKPVGRQQRAEYKKTFEYLIKFGEKHKKQELDFKDIDLDFHADFLKYLQDEGLAANTCGRKIQTLKAFMNAALEEGKTDHQGHKSLRFRAPYEKPDTIALDKEELQKIADLDLNEIIRLDRVRDIFLIGCWTGIRFGDLMRIRPEEDIKNGLLHVRQAKTGKTVPIPLHPVVKRIFDKYNGELPPPISNQKFNKYIREVCKAAKIDDTVHITSTRGGVTRTVKHKKWELVSSHTARRSFATNLYRDGFPSLSIMRITGHSSESAFLRYIRVSDEEYAQQLSDHWNKLHAV